MYKPQVIERIVNIETKSKIIRTLFTELMTSETKLQRGITEKMVANAINGICEDLTAFRKEYEPQQTEKVSEIKSEEVIAIPPEKKFTGELEIGLRGAISILGKIYGKKNLREVADEIEKNVKYYAEIKGNVEHVGTFDKKKNVMHYDKQGDLI